MTNCENCISFTEKEVVDPITDETYYEPDCKMGVALTSENVIYVKNCEDFVEVKNEEKVEVR